MLAKFNFFKERKEEFYRREVARILYNLVQENDLPSFSLSYCDLRGQGELLQIYLNFSQKKSQVKLLELMNEKYSALIKRELAKSKKFAFIPKLVFLCDKEVERCNNLEEIFRQIN